MSIFRTQTFKCPSCGADGKFNVCYSVNADRRADFRKAILANTFQRGTCGGCGDTFRLDPELTYLHVKGKLFALVRPVGGIAEWPDLEEQAYSAFEAAYGEHTPLMVQDIGRDLRLRATFGWAALREKILAAEKGLDDVTLELTKMALISGLGNVPLADNAELRLLDAQGDQLGMACLEVPSGKILETMTVPRTLYDEVAADETGWKAMRDELTAGPFVDIHRLLVEPAESPAA